MKPTLTAVITEVKTAPYAAPRNNMVAVVRTDCQGRTGWSFEKSGIKAGDSVLLADGRTTAVIDYVRNH